MNALPCRDVAPLRACLRPRRTHAARCVCLASATQAEAAPPTAADAASLLAPRTRELLATLPRPEVEAGGAGGASTWEALQRADAVWAKLRGAAPPNSQPAAPFVRRLRGSRLPTGKPTFDVAVCGGTLGIVFGAALAARGLRIAVVERGPLRGRDQEWNISRAELLELVDAGVLTHADVASVVVSDFSPGTCALHGDPRGPLRVAGVLNLGVSPNGVVDAARRALESRGGCVVRERTAVSGLSVHDDGVSLDGTDITSRLVLDCMGHASPVVAQARGGRRPDGVCLVVGSCARGFSPAANAAGGDILVTTQPIGPCGGDGLLSQNFWEAFPASSGPTDRTTYMFTYIEADPARPSLTSYLESYWSAVESYQNVKLSDLQLLRVLFGAFPTYRDSPLGAPFDRILPVGDACGIQSPLSFGGFGAVTRHAGRIAAAVEEALRVERKGGGGRREGGRPSDGGREEEKDAEEEEAELLSASALSRINPYLPNLSAAWLFQRAMSVHRGAVTPHPQFVNTLLATNFGVMARLGDGVLRPFLLDVPRLDGLGLTLGGMMIANPLLIPQILVHVGPWPLIDWLGHFMALIFYTVAAHALRPLRPAVGALPLGRRGRFALRRAIDAFEYGSGLDFQPPRDTRGGG